MKASPSATAWAIASRTQEKADAAAKEFDIPVAHGSYEALLADRDIEAVYIPLPNHLHAEYAKRALAAGKHVLCEKPIGLTAEQTRGIGPVPEGLILAEAFMVRHHPQWIKARELIRSGEFGRLVSVNVMLGFALEGRDDYRFVPEFGGGALYDLGCYAIMSARYLFGSEPVRVCAHTVIDEASGTDSMVSALLDFGEGRTATFSAWVHAAVGQRAQVVCENGLFDLPAALLPSDSLPAEIVIERSGIYEAPDRITVSVPQRDQYAEEITNFSLAVRGERQLEFGYADSISQMQVIDAVFASAKSRRWVEV